MTKSTDQQRALWKRLARERGLVLDGDVLIELDSGPLVAPVVLRGYGAKRGMVLVSHYSTIADFANELVQRGFGYSCVTLDDNWDDATVDEMLKDRGPNDAAE